MSAVTQPLGAEPRLAGARRSFAWLARRLVAGVAVLWAAATFTFLVQSLLPGDRAQLIINLAAGNIVTATPAELDAVNAKYGFDQPLIAQYASYIAGLARGDLGISYQQHKPVTEIIAAQIWPTVALAFSALAAAWIIAIAVTVLAAGRDNRWSRLATGAQVVLATLPPYWIGTILLVIFAVQLRIFPVEGRNSLIGLVLPTLSLALPLSGFLGQALQDEFTRVLEQPFVTSARMRGMSDLGVRLRHALRHAVLPGISLSGWAIGKLFSGAVLIEAVFARQGLGGILVSATSARDIPLVTGIIILSAAIYIVASILVDRTYSIIDPRIKLA
jgi:peptide/nickel transport system permease protein